MGDAKRFLRAAAAPDFFAAVVPVLCEVLVNGAGATFPYPTYAKWIDEFERMRPEARINYQAVGSGAGIRNLLSGTVDFGASDQPMTDGQLKAAPVRILHFPNVTGAAVPVYNVAGLRKPLRFTPEALAGIFLGRIRKWNDRALAGANPGARLPDAAIAVVHRSGGSGTTFLWTELLSKTNAEWKRRVGAGTPCRNREKILSERIHVTVIAAQQRSPTLSACRRQDTSSGASGCCWRVWRDSTPGNWRRFWTAAGRESSERRAASTPGRDCTSLRSTR
jgi:ABC-type phosphate transport system substrate-binding protein